MVRNLEDCLNQINRSTAFRRALMQQPSIDTPLRQPLLDAVALFSRLNIPYALIGGIAAMVYGRSRFTEDVDFVASAGHQTILAAHPQVMQECNFDPASTWKLYHASGVEIDIWKDEFSDQIAGGAREIQLAGATVRIADVHDLIAMKLRARRFQDDYDISEILRAHSTPISDTTLERLVSPDQFAHFQSIKKRLHFA